MDRYRHEFNTLLGVKVSPNEHEEKLFQRAQKYIVWLRCIPGIEMIAVCNSLSMYATHADSDIDLFIVTEKWMIWFVRFFVTLTLWLHGVWRHGDDIAENFCLSFFVSHEALDLWDIAYKDDIYLAQWIYHLKPILSKEGIYDKFLYLNTWAEVDGVQKEENLRYLLPDTPYEYMRFLFPVFRMINRCIRFFLLPKTLKNYEWLWRPEGVIISDQILKFHDKDKRREINNGILKENFDK